MLMHLLEHPRTTTVTNHHCTSSTSSALHFKTTPSVLLTTIFLKLYAGMFHYETETVLTGMKNFQQWKDKQAAFRTFFCHSSERCFVVRFFLQSGLCLCVGLWHTWFKRKALPSSPHLREHSDLWTHPMHVLLEHIRSAPHSSYISLTKHFEGRAYVRELQQ